MHSQEEQSLLRVFRTLGAAQRRAVYGVATCLAPQRPQLRLVVGGSGNAPAEASDLDDEAPHCLVDAWT
jgi:hypothetical protein